MMPPQPARASVATTTIANPNNLLNVTAIKTNLPRELTGHDYTPHGYRAVTAAQHHDNVKVVEVGLGVRTPP
ncbi:MAG: hypothetical protein J0I48_22935, partial [Devosia sp.]|nr:hypothetical protein [Devosia sp.]